MACLIGTDEAGYGPNLGPLVVAASVWDVPTGLRCADLYQALAGAVTASAERGSDNSARRVAIADSKSLYQSGGNLRLLERGLWAAIGQFGRPPRSWRDAWLVLAPESAPVLLASPEYADYDEPLPLHAAPGELESLRLALADALAAAGVRLAGLGSRVVLPEQFNDLLDRHQSKGAALSQLTIGLAAGLAAGHGDGPVEVVCDKHGGRDRYAPLLQEHFPDYLVEVHGEGRAQSIYRFGPMQQRFEVRFSAKAEAYLPVALASMAAKYLRELAMRGLNAFWRARVPGLAPTAGYPLDAKRYKAAIAAVQAKLGIDDRVVWRLK